MYQIIDLYYNVDAWKWNDTCSHLIGEISWIINREVIRVIR